MAWIRSIRFRYSLRALAIFLTLFAIWGAYHSERGRKERRAQAVLSRYDSGFNYGPKPSRGTLLDHGRFGYERLVQALWREPFIIRASLHSPLDSEAVEALTGLRHLESLTIDSAPFGSHKRPTVDLPPGALERILENDRLTDLTFGSWRLSDEDCRAVARHQNLERFRLFESDISEDGLAMVVTLPRLRALVVSDCKVTGEKLALVPGSSSLKFIHCHKAGVHREFAKFVARSPNVSELYTWEDAIDDEFVADLRSHPSLSNLTLMSGSITDDSATHLATMPALETVVVSKLMLSAKAIDGLKAAKPKLVVSQ